MHGVESADDFLDASRQAFVQKALDSAALLIQTQFESETFRRDIRYTIVR